jgi:endoglucanase
MNRRVRIVQAGILRHTVGAEDTQHEWTRGELLVAALIGALGLPAAAAARRRPRRPPLPSATWRRLPRWRGFNLAEKGSVAWGNAGLPYRQWDFDFIAKHGFNFVRLPLDYRLWTPSAGGSVRQLQDIDHAVALAGARNIHVNLAFFNVPGRVSSGPPEPDGIDLWADGAGGDEARRRFAGQWQMLAARYRRISSTKLSFNLLNEPSGSIFRLDRRGQHRAYLRALAPAVAAIGAVEPSRLMIADALSSWAVVNGSPRPVEGNTDPVRELYRLRVAQSFHCYLPTLLTHYRVPWIKGSGQWPVPTWPYTNSSRAVHEDWILPGPWNRGRILQRLADWRGVAAAGVGVHAGEFGCYNQTPHGVTLAWMRDVLSVFRGLGVGWALWNLRGSFGVADSQRSDARYRRDGGHAVDVRMLALLKAF